jgi:uncharacterized protein (TIGR03086 family)
MDNRINTLDDMFSKTAHVLRSVADDQHGKATPCGEFDVAAVLNHIAVWVQVFDTAVNDRTLPFDPMTHAVTADWADVFTSSSARILDGLRARGFERPMTMMSGALPGEFVLNMLLMEYIGHGWDLCRAIDQRSPYSDHESETALAAAQAIIEPQYRGTGMFEAEVIVSDSSAAIDRFVAFLGRDPHWISPARV